MTLSEQGRRARALGHLNIARQSSIMSISRDEVAEGSCIPSHDYARMHDTHEFELFSPASTKPDVTGGAGAEASTRY